MFYKEGKTVWCGITTQVTDPISVFSIVTDLGTTPIFFSTDKTYFYNVFRGYFGMNEC